MAILSVNEDYKAMSASDQIDPDQVTVITGQAQRRFQVLFDTADNAIDRPFMALDSDSVPNLWESHPSYEFWFVSNKNAVFGNGPLEVFVDVHYEYIADPLNQPPSVTYHFERTTEPVDRDINGKAVLNSAGEPFDPAIQEDFTTLVTRIVKNEADYDPLTAQDYIDAVNNVPWAPACIGKIFPAQTSKCTLIDSLPQRYGATTYYQKTYEFKSRNDKKTDGTLIGWKRRFLDQGLRQKTDSGFTAIVDDANKAITTPVPLNGSGQPLTFDANDNATNLPDPTDDIDVGTNSVYLLFETKKQKDFSGLGL